MGISPATFCTWGPGTGTAFYGAASFSTVTDSTITLASTVPNVFATDGDYVKFDIFVDDESTDRTVFGNTDTPDTVVLNYTATPHSISVTDGTTTATVDLDSDLSINTWYTVKVHRSSSTLYVDIDDVQQAGSATPVEIDIDIIGKNKPAYSDVYSILFNGDEHQYLTKASPSTNVQGDAANGFWRCVAFELSGVGNQAIIDNMSGNDGWKIEVVNVYYDTHKLKFTVGNGSTTTSLTSTETFAVGDKVLAYVDLEHLGGGEPDAGATTLTGTFSQNSSNVYVGATAGTSNFFYGKLHTIIGADGVLSETEQTWLLNSGEGRSLDEITVSSEVSNSEVDFGWSFSESTGTRSDEYGTDDLTEAGGEIIGTTYLNGGFETEGTGTNADLWTRPFGATDCQRIITDANTGSASFQVIRNGSQVLFLSSAALEANKTYSLSVYAKIDDLTGSPQFVIKSSSPNGHISEAKAFTSTSWTEYTATLAPTVDCDIGIQVNDSNADGDTALFDDFTITITSGIGRDFGLKSTRLNSAVMTGYLREVSIVTPLVNSTWNLYTNALDSSNDSNDGTAIGVTFVGTDPGA